MPSYVVSHGSGFRYKRKVPKHLRDAVGTAVWVEYLGSAMNRRGAEAKARLLARRDDQRIALLETLKPEERAKAVADGALDIVGASELDLNGREQAVPFVAIAEFLKPDPQAPQAEKAAQALEIVQAQEWAENETRQIALGRKALRKLPGRPTHLDVLVEAWIKANKPRAVHTIDGMRRSVRHFVDNVGNIRPRNVTKDHAAKYRDRLDKLDLKHRTKRKYLEQLNTLFNTALSERLVDVNPFTKIKLAKEGGKFVDEEGKKAFEPHQVRAIFDALAGEHLDFAWVTRLCAYHGMRSGEAAQLRKEDVTTSFGVTVLRLHDEHGTIKNRHSVRTIPLHPACKDFVAYAEAAEGPWIFASFPVWKEGRRGQAYQRRGTDFLRKIVGISDPDLTLHSLRHTWTTLAAALNMPYAVAHAITGHTLGGGEHAKYTHAPPLKEQLRWLKRIDPLNS